MRTHTHVCCTKRHHKGSSTHTTWLSIPQHVQHVQHVVRTCIPQHVHTISHAAVHSTHTTCGRVACRRDRDRHRDKDRDRGGKEEEDIGIKEANELRAKLGMKPLRA
eukprot:scaffold18934_cov23-Tisochrysis_lutea.AAC.1